MAAVMAEQNFDHRTSGGDHDGQADNDDERR
jgi:hypothetical protein